MSPYTCIPPHLYPLILSSTITWFCSHRQTEKVISCTAGLSEKLYKNYSDVFFHQAHFRNITEHGVCSFLRKKIIVFGNRIAGSCMSLEVLVYVSGKFPSPDADGISAQLPSLWLSGSLRPDSKLNSTYHRTSFWLWFFQALCSSPSIPVCWSCCGMYAVYTVLGHVLYQALLQELRTGTSRKKEYGFLTHYVVSKGWWPTQPTRPMGNLIMPWADRGKVSRGQGHSHIPDPRSCSRGPYMEDHTDGEIQAQVYGIFELERMADKSKSFFTDTRKAAQQATCLRPGRRDERLSPLAQSFFHHPTHKAAVPRALPMKRFSLQILGKCAKSLCLCVCDSFHPNRHSKLNKHGS